MWIARCSCLALALALAVAPAAPAVDPQEPPRGERNDGPSKAEIAAALAALKTGLAAKEPSERIAALQSAAEVVHADVVKAIAKATADPAVEVRDFALDLLGKIDEPTALESLHTYLNKHRKELVDDPDRYVLVMKSAARHRNPKTIPLLTDKMFDTQHHLVVRARILALANLPDKRAVEAVFDIVTKGDRRKVLPHMDSVQLTLLVLLGVDVGTNLDRCIAWWNENKKTYELAAAFPKLPEARLRDWQTFWGLELTYERNKKRGDRGRD